MARREASRSDVADLVDRLLAGSIDRRTASLFARTWTQPEGDDDVRDALELLEMIDAWQVGDPTSHMFDLSELEALRPRLD